MATPSPTPSAQGVPSSSQPRRRSPRTVSALPRHLRQESWVGSSGVRTDSLGRCFIVLRGCWVPALTHWPLPVLSSYTASCRICCRCGTEYLVSSSGRCVRSEECYYHWGRLRRNRGEPDCLTAVAGSHAHARPAGWQGPAHLTPPRRKAWPSAIYMFLPSTGSACLTPAVSPRVGTSPRPASACDAVAQILSLNPRP